MQDEGRSYLGEGNFGSGRKEGATDEESRVKEEKNTEATGNITEVARDGEEAKGRT